MSDGGSHLHALLLGLAVALGSHHADAGPLYRSTQPGDVPRAIGFGARTSPAATQAAGSLQAAARTAGAVASPPAPSAIAGLRIEARGGHYLAWADNRLAGPVEVMLSAEGGGIASDPALPARAQVGEGASALVAVFEASIRTRLSLDAVPGDPSARVQAFVYRLPLALPHARIDQGFAGSYSHSDDENRYALDFAVPEGTPVLAARAGRVMQVESRFQRGGSSAGTDGPRANFIRIVHDDGTMALYAHLQPQGASVRMGQRVEAGQPIGRSGNTGFSSGPHLHFAVQVNRGMRLQSLPFQMQGLAAPQEEPVADAP